MNRILTADVILTLTAEQARHLSSALFVAACRSSQGTERKRNQELRDELLRQMRMQGVDA